MVGSFYAVGGSFQLARFRLGVGYQFFQGLPFRVFLNYNYAGLGQVVADGDNALIVKGSVGLDRQGSISRKVDETNGISVRFSLGQLGPSNFAVGAGFVFDDHGLAHVGFGIVQQQAGACIGAGTGLIGNNDLHVLCGLPVFAGIGGLLVATAASAARHQDGCSQHQGPCYSKNFFHEFLLLR